MTAEVTDADRQQPLTLVCDRAAPRLDRFLSESLPQLSRRQGRELCEAGRVYRNGSKARAGDALFPGDTVEVFGEVETGQLRPELASHVPLELLYEDSAVIVAAKPRMMPSVRHRADDPLTMADLIVHREPSCAAAGEDPREGGLVQRLDTATSGALIAAKTRAVWLTLRADLQRSRIEKSYLALVEGVLQPPRQRIARPIETPRNSPTVSVLAEDEHESGSAAETEVTLLRAFSGFSVVRALAPQARRHQIRAHLAALGHPLVGDAQYGSSQRLADVYRALSGDASGAELLGEGFLLHAERVSFDHPDGATEGIGRIECRAPSHYFDMLSEGHGYGS